MKDREGESVLLFIGLHVLHHLAPAEIAEHGKDGVGHVYTSFEGKALVGKQIDVDDVHHEPQPPQLQILLCHGPHGHYGYGIGEGILHRHGRVGVVI